MRTISFPEASRRGFEGAGEEEEGGVEARDRKAREEGRKEGDVDEEATVRRDRRGVEGTRIR